jgi:hypothetical protein
MLFAAANENIKNLDFIMFLSGTRSGDFPFRHARHPPILGPCFAKQYDSRIERIQVDPIYRQAEALGASTSS